MMFSPTGFTMRATAVPLPNLINMLQNQVGRPIIDKTDLKGLFDFQLQFSPEGLASPALNGGTPFGPLPGGPSGRSRPGHSPASISGSCSIAFYGNSRTWLETGILERPCASTGRRFGAEADRKLGPAPFDEEITHSLRRAITGSIAAARRAGRYEARIAARASRAVTAENVVHFTITTL